MRGNFVTFEGPEGSGKSSVCQAVLQAFACDMLLVREPGSTSLGEKIRTLIHNENMPDRSELMLFEAARACIVDTVINPALQAGRNVLCDRFYDSTTAYQGFGRGMSLPDIHIMNSMATGGLEPDLTILLDIDPDVAMARKGQAQDRIEAAGMEFHRRVRNGYIEIAMRESRFAVVDALKPAAEVAAEVCGIIRRRLGWQAK